MTRTSLKPLAMGIAIGLIIAVIMLYVFRPNMLHSTSLDNEEQASNDEPLYWVAPMDPNFKRDKPGKSPMGMDLVPVYKTDSAQDEVGAVSIDPVTIQNLGVKTVNVEKISPKSSIRTYGEIAFAQDNIVHIHPRVEAWVETLSVRSTGDYIEQGEPLYSLYSPDLVNAQEELLIALQQANKALISAAQSRLLSLNVPQSLIDSIRKSGKIKRAITYYAPQSGYVSELNIQEGFYVKPSTTMLAIASLEQVWVYAEVFASDASKIMLGQNAIIHNAYLPQSKTAATIDYIYPTISTNTRTMKARLRLENPSLALKPGMYVDVVIDAASSKDAKLDNIIAVPKQAVIRTGDADRVVLVLGEGRYKSINITLGRVFDDVFEVLSGVKEGDEVVSSAQFLLDSESSISSDFMRMEAPMEENIIQQDSDISSWTQATVNEVIIDERLINLTHGPLDEFNMMGMTMNFMLSDTIDISDFKEGQEVHVEIIKSASGMYQINTVHFMEHMDASDSMMNRGEQP